MEEKSPVQETSSQTESTRSTQQNEENIDWKYKLTHVGKIIIDSWLIP